MKRLEAAFARARSLLGGLGLRLCGLVLRLWASLW